MAAMYLESQHMKFTAEDFDESAQTFTLYVVGIGIRLLHRLGIVHDAGHDFFADGGHCWHRDCNSNRRARHDSHCLQLSFRHATQFRSRRRLHVHEKNFWQRQRFFLRMVPLDCLCLAFVG